MARGPARAQGHQKTQKIIIIISSSSSSSIGKIQDGLKTRNFASKDICHVRISCMSSGRTERVTENGVGQAGSCHH